MFAQSLVEYGALTTVAAGLAQLRSTVWYWLTNIPLTSWLIVGIVFLAVVFLWSHRPQRL